MSKSSLCTHHKWRNKASDYHKPSPPVPEKYFLGVRGGHGHRHPSRAGNVICFTTEYPDFEQVQSQRVGELRAKAAAAKNYLKEPLSTKTPWFGFYMNKDYNNIKNSIKPKPYYEATKVVHDDFKREHEILHPNLAYYPDGKEWLHANSQKYPSTSYLRDYNPDTDILAQKYYERINHKKPAFSKAVPSTWSSGGVDVRAYCPPLYLAEKYGRARNAHLNKNSWMKTAPLPGDHDYVRPLSRSRNSRGSQH